MNHSSGYAQFPPPDALRPFVDFLWINRITGPPPEGGRRLLPDGRASLVWIPNRSLHVAGPQTRFKQPPDIEDIRVFGARLRPGAIRSLLGVPAVDLVDEHVSLDAIDSTLAARLGARLDATHDTRSGLRALAAELTRRVADARSPDAVLRTAVRLLDRRDASVADTAGRVYLSERALQRRFAEDIGYGPKMLQRVLRFQRFLRAVPNAELAGAAAVAGYADQSHLTREATRLAGLTPLQLRTFRH
jgi:AraC-like DNA-binding protein